MKPLAILMSLTLVLLVLTSGCANNQGGEGQPLPVTTPQKHSDYDLPISSRDFYMGVVPMPKSDPETTWDDINEAYAEAGRIGEVAMVWAQPSGIGQTDKLKQNQLMTAFRVHGLKPVVTLQFATIQQVPGKGLVYEVAAPAGINPDLSDPGFRQAWVAEARALAREFKPEYFSLGNEVNDYFHQNPGELDDYIVMFDEAYKAIKQESPQTKVFVVFSYTHLIDGGQWEMLRQFDGRADMIGLTTYPWKHFDDPADMTPDYYARVKQYTSKPVAFTEIGWISSSGAGSSEGEQAEFLVRFLELTKGMDVEFVNWLFLHEIELEGVAASVSSPETGTIALRKADGTKKEVYDVWLDVHSLPHTA